MKHLMWKGTHSTRWAQKWGKKAFYQRGQLSWWCHNLLHLLALSSILTFYIPRKESVHSFQNFFLIWMVVKGEVSCVVCKLKRRGQTLGQKDGAEEGDVGEQSDFSVAQEHCPPPTVHSSPVFQWASLGCAQVWLYVQLALWPRGLFISRFSEPWT